VNALFPGSWHAEVLAGILLVAGLYRIAARRTTRPSAAERSTFAAALVVLLLALNGPLHDLSDAYLFSAHMVQHLLLTLVVPPLLLLGTPGAMIDALLERFRPLSATVRMCRRPLPALALYAAALIVWHLPGPYGAALEHHALHVVEHLTLMATATLAWWPVLGRSRVAPALPYGAQLLYLFAFGIPMTAVAAMVTSAEQVLYAFYAAAPRVASLDPLADQRLGGLLMWVPAGVIPVVAFTAVFFRWAAVERDPDDAEAFSVDSNLYPK
jgi:putative membrane protein